MQEMIISNMIFSMELKRPRVTQVLLQRDLDIVLDDLSNKVGTYESGQASFYLIV